MRYALGLVEAIGLATAVEAADAMVKSANVKFLGIEPTKGDGMQVIKVFGNVGAVEAACKAGEAACDKGRGCFSVKIIARPADKLAPILWNTDTKGFDPKDCQYYGSDFYWKFPKYDQKKPTCGQKISAVPKD